MFRKPTDLITYADLNFKQVLFFFLLDLPPPPPEAFDNPDDDTGKQNVQSRTFKMLQDAVDQGGYVSFFIPFYNT